MSPQGGRPPASSLQDHHHYDILRFLRKKLRNSEDAKELTQEVHMRLARRPAELMRNPRAYALKTAKRVYADFYKKKRQSVVDCDSNKLEDVAEPEVGIPMDEQVEMRQIAEKALSTLPATHFKVFWLTYIKRLPVTEIATVLRLSKHTVVKYGPEAKRLLLLAFGKDI
jgi:RNA polymerase sigma-70 factor, ECF subfamily